MADRSNHEHALHGAALVVLAACAVRHYAYTLAPAADRADWANAIGALMLMIAPLYAAWRWPSPLVWAAAALWVIEEAMIVGCSVAYIIRPWVVPEGQDQCSALLGFELGKLGAAVLAGVLGAIVLARRKTL